MKKLFYAVLFFGFTISVTSQNTPEVGEALVINEPYAQTYKHVKFPRLNFLTKRGKVANYKSVYNNLVIVDEVITKDDGSTIVILKKKDGSKFFGFLSKVKANYTKAIAAKELAVVN